MALCHLAAQEVLKNSGREGEKKLPRKIGKGLRQLLSNFWRLEQLFAVLVTSSKFCLSEQLLSKI